MPANPLWIEGQIGELGEGHLLQGRVRKGIVAPHLPALCIDGDAAVVAVPQAVDQGFKWI